MKAIMIDGPQAGVVVEVGSAPSFLFPRHRPLSFREYFGGLDHFLPSDLSFDVDYYNIYRVRVLDFELAVGSMKSMGEMLGSHEWATTVSELARQQYAVA